MWQNAGSIKNCLEIIGFKVFVALVTKCIMLFLGCSSKRFSYLFGCSDLGGVSLQVFSVFCYDGYDLQEMSVWLQQSFLQKHC